MKDSGKAIMGAGVAEGEDRAEKAIKDAIHSPLLNDSNIEGAKNILLYITSGTNEVSLDEVDEILEIAQNACGNNSDVIWGNGTDESLGESLSVTLIATGFNHDAKPYTAILNEKKTDTPLTPKKVYGLDGTIKGEQPASQPSQVKETIVPIVETPQPVQPEVKTPEVKHEERTVHPLFTPEPPKAVEPKVPEPENTKVPEPVEGPTETIEDDIPAFEPINEPTPATPIRETPSTVHYEEERPVVRVFDNPFRSESSDDEGFEITSRIITQEEVKAKAEQQVALLEAKKAKELDPKEQLKKQRLRALSMNFRTARGLEELENQPAYLRRNVEISHADADEGLSQYSTSKNGISGENSYLHKNVD